VERERERAQKKISQNRENKIQSCYESESREREKERERERERGRGSEEVSERTWKKRRR
jgi:hypothetical protein